MAARVWTKFTAKKSDGTVLKLRIQDMPADRFEDVVNLFCSYYLESEVSLKIVGLPNNPEAVAENLVVSREMLKASTSPIVVCCEDNGDAVGEIIGASANGITTFKDKIEDFKINYKTKEMEQVMDIYIKLFSLYDVLKSNNVDSYLDDRGLAVAPGFADSTIHKELLNVRRKLCKEHKVPFVGGWVTTDDWQKAATADGWETAYQASREEIGEKIGFNITEGPSTWKFIIGRPL